VHVGAVEQLELATLLGRDVRHVEAAVARHLDIGQRRELGGQVGRRAVVRPVGLVRIEEVHPEEERRAVRVVDPRFGGGNGVLAVAHLRRGIPGLEAVEAERLTAQVVH
jgi:hypothetical protein